MTLPTTGTSPVISFTLLIFPISAGGVLEITESASPPLYPLTLTTPIYNIIKINNVGSPIRKAFFHSLRNNQFRLINPVPAIAIAAKGALTPTRHAKQKRDTKQSFHLKLSA